MKVLLIIITLIASFSSKSQLRVEYDYMKKNIIILDNMDTVSEAVIKNRGSIDLYLKNLDPTHKVDIKKEEATITYDGSKQEIEKVASGKGEIYHRINNITSDQLNVTITVSDTNDKVLANVGLSVRTYGKWKLDVSTGAIFNIGLSDANYSIENNVIVKSGKENALVPVFPTVLTHAYRKSSGDFNWGASFGFGISDNERTSYYAGLGFLFGEEQRLVLNAGLALRNVTRLKDQYSENQTFSSNTPDSNNITEDPYRIGGFFAITYNLTSKSN